MELNWYPIFDELGSFQLIIVLLGEAEGTSDVKVTARPSELVMRRETNFCDVSERFSEIFLAQNAPCESFKCTERRKREIEKIGNFYAQPAPTLMSSTNSCLDLCWCGVSMCGWGWQCGWIKFCRQIFDDQQWLWWIIEKISIPGWSFNQSRVWISSKFGFFLFHLSSNVHHSQTYALQAQTLMPPTSTQPQPAAHVVVMGGNKVIRDSTPSVICLFAERWCRGPVELHWTRFTSKREKHSPLFFRFSCSLPKPRDKGKSFADKKLIPKKQKQSAVGVVVLSVTNRERLQEGAHSRALPVQKRSRDASQHLCTASASQWLIKTELVSFFPTPESKKKPKWVIGERRWWLAGGFWGLQWWEFIASFGGCKTFVTSQAPPRLL